jgi:hypothetical protein
VRIVDELDQCSLSTDQPVQVGRELFDLRALVAKNFRDSALNTGSWLSRTMRSTLVKNWSLRSRLAGILPTISLRVCSVASARSRTSGSRSRTVDSGEGIDATYGLVGLNLSAIGGGGFLGTSSSRYASPVTGFPITWARIFGNTASAAYVSNRVTFAPIVARRSRYTSNVISIVFPTGSARMPDTRPSGTPRYRTGLEMSRPLTLSVV